MNKKIRFFSKYVENKIVAMDIKSILSISTLRRSPLYLRLTYCKKTKLNSTLFVCAKLNLIGKKQAIQ